MHFLKYLDSKTLQNINYTLYGDSEEGTLRLILQLLTLEIIFHKLTISFNF